MKPLTRLLTTTGIFAIAMGFLESAVVVYLRAIVYPAGFAFPLKEIPGTLGLTEILREAATVVMLLAIAWISVPGMLRRFAVFIYAFAVWDIFYYVFLYALLGWPPSLFTWDILFLIPVPWTGPVLAPVINSLTMILLAFLILRFKGHREDFRLNSTEWTLLILGSVVTIFVYCESFLKYLHSAYNFSEFFRHGLVRKNGIYDLLFIPSDFNWKLFVVSEILFLLAIIGIIRRANR